MSTCPECGAEADRCTSRNQGDRCDLTTDHLIPHSSAFHEWTDEFADVES